MESTHSSSPLTCSLPNETSSRIRHVAKMPTQTSEVATIGRVVQPQNNDMKLQTSKTDDLSADRLTDISRVFGQLPCGIRTHSFHSESIVVDRGHTDDQLESND